MIENKLTIRHFFCLLLIAGDRLETMESMALHQETAYERLYRWTQGEQRQQWLNLA